MNALYEFQRGETILLALDAVEGDPATVTAITGTMRLQLAPHTETNFEVVARTGGWTLTIDPEVSATMPVGIYQAVATLTLPAQTVITDPVQVRLK